jgi:ribonuclease HI
MEICVYSDGSGTTATKTGGWAYVIVVDGVGTQEGAGRLECATNNDCELEAAIQGLAALLKYKFTFDNQVQLSDIYLVSDSQIVLNWANGTSRFKQESKMQKYRQLTALMERLGVKTRWVRGHSGNEFNERCDKLANIARKGLTEESQKIRKKSTKIRKMRKDSPIFYIQYENIIKVIDLSKDSVQNYDESIHGKIGE